MKPFFSAPVVALPLIGTLTLAATVLTAQAKPVASPTPVAGVTPGPRSGNRPSGTSPFVKRPNSAPADSPMVHRPGSGNSNFPLVQPTPRIVNPLRQHSPNRTAPIPPNTAPPRLNPPRQRVLPRRNLPPLSRAPQRVPSAAHDTPRHLMGTVIENGPGALFTLRVGKHNYQVTGARKPSDFSRGDVVALQGHTRGNVPSSLHFVADTIRIVRNR